MDDFPVGDLPALPGALPVATAASLSALEEPASNNHRTAQRAVDVLLAKDPRYRCPTSSERQALLLGFARRGKVLIGSAYDVVRVEGELNLSDDAAIAGALERVTLCEIKSTNRRTLGADLKGYFFNITAAEQLTAQSLGARYRLLFVNTITGEHQEMSFSEVLGRAKAIYPSWHIKL
jgi:hypothetical protein